MLDEDGPLPEDWRPRLSALALRLRSRYVAVPGFATHLARPHTHNAEAIDRLRAVVVGAFEGAAVSPEAAEQSWVAYITAVTAWIAVDENAPAHGDTGGAGAAQRFDRFVDALLRGLPVAE